MTLYDHEAVALEEEERTPTFGYRNLLLGGAE